MVNDAPLVSFIDHLNPNDSSACVSTMSRPDGLKQSYTYDAAMFFWRIITQIFFREIRPRSAFHIPRLEEGPVIFVGAPHNNQVCSSEMFQLLK